MHNFMVFEIFNLRKFHSSKFKYCLSCKNSASKITRYTVVHNTVDGYYTFPSGLLHFKFLFSWPYEPTKLHNFLRETDSYFDFKMLLLAM